MMYNDTPSLSHAGVLICFPPVSASVCLKCCVCACVQGAGSSADFYVVRNGRLSALDEPLQPGAVYHLQPRLCGGKGGASLSAVPQDPALLLWCHVSCFSGFGSMLRALGAQIEKTTNREACRDLSGRRLRDVNHEKE